MPYNSTYTCLGIFIRIIYRGCLIFNKMAVPAKNPIRLFVCCYLLGFFVFVSRFCLFVYFLFYYLFFLI